MRSDFAELGLFVDKYDAVICDIKIKNKFIQKEKRT